jgi:hypothetical protein
VDLPPHCFPSPLRLSCIGHRSAPRLHHRLLTSCHLSATREPPFSAATFTRRELELQSLPGVCALSQWHSPGRPCPLWAAVRSLVASPLQLSRARIAHRSRTLVRVLGSAVVAPCGPAQPLAGCAPVDRKPLLSQATCSLSGPRCIVVLGREAVLAHGAVVKT